jgi:hypothetical protein
MTFGGDTQISSYTFTTIVDGRKSFNISKSLEAQGDMFVFNQKPQGASGRPIRASTGFCIHITP